MASSSNSTEHSIGVSKDFPEGKGRLVKIEGKQLAVFRHNGELGCIENTCLHVGGPLSEGRVKDGRVFCPWHDWDYDFKTGAGFGDESVGSYRIWEEDGKVIVDLSKPLHPKKIAPQHKRITINPVKRNDDEFRILGISTTHMNQQYPRASTSEWVLEEACAGIVERHSKVKTKIVKLRELNIKNCEGYYSKDKGACIWPCSITQADKKDEMEVIYRGMVEWCDIVVVATPIRWNSASSHYYKMQERLNALQNQLTLHDKVLINNKAACFIITGGQDGVQSVAGQMMMFFGELGFTFPQFPFIGWSRGWYNEEMKTQFQDVEQSDLAEEAINMLERAVRLIEVYRTGHHSGSHKKHK